MLSSISGFSDSFTFVAFNKLFSSHITGNIIISIIFLFSHTPGVMVIISALPVYIVFSFIFAFFFNRFNFLRDKCYFWVFLEMIIFLFLMLLCLFNINKAEYSSFSYLIICMLPIIGMSVHNICVHKYFKNLPPYYVMTGNISKIVFYLSNKPFEKKNITNYEQNKKNFLILVFTLFGFTFGALVSVIGYFWIKFNILIFIVILQLILFLLVYFYKNSKK